MQCQKWGWHGEHSDAAKRLRDEYALHRLTDPIGNTGRWFAVALQDGSSDHVLYDTRRDAVTHQHHNEMYYAYIQIVPATMTLCDAESFLAAVRKIYDSGTRLTDRDHRAGGREVIARATQEDQYSLIRSINRGGLERPSNLIIPGRN